MSQLHTHTSPNPRLISVLAVVVRMIMSMLCGICTALLMVGFGVAMALGAMAGPAHRGDFIVMLLITVPTAFIYAFFARRAGVIKAVFGGLSFSVPVVLLCYSSNMDPTQQSSVEQIRVVHQVAWITTGIAVSASAFFALLARASGETNVGQPNA